MATPIAFFALFGILMLFVLGFLVFIVANAGKGRNDWFPPSDGTSGHFADNHTAINAQNENGELGSQLESSDSGAPSSDSGSDSGASEGN